MFPVLGRKLRIYLIGTVLVITSFLFFLVYFCFYHFLFPDIDSTSLNLHRQIARNVDVRVSQIDNTVNTYMAKSGVLTQLGVAESGITNYNSLYSAMNYFRDYVMVFINMNDGKEYYSTAESKRLFGSFVSENNIEQRVNGDKGCWTFMKIESKQYYLYTKPVIFEGENKISGYVTIASSDFGRRFFENTNNKLCDGDFYYLCSEGYTASFHGKKSVDDIPEYVINNVVKSGKSQIYDKYRIYVTPVFDGRITLVSCSARVYARDLLKKLPYMLLIAFFAIGTLCFIFADRFTAYVITSLERLNIRVESYLNTQTRE